MVLAHLSFTIHSLLLVHLCWEITLNVDGVGIGQITVVLKSHDKKMAASCVCCGESESKFCSLRSKKYAKFYEI